MASSKPYRAFVKYNGKKLWLGDFATEDEKTQVVYAFRVLHNMPSHDEQSRAGGRRWWASKTDEERQQFAEARRAEAAAKRREGGRFVTS